MMSGGVVDRATGSDAFEWPARAGFAISGLLHLVIAYIILQLAIGSGGTADQSGALSTVADQIGGLIMLWIAAIGLFALGLWRVAETWVGKRPSEGSGSEDTEWTDRVKSFGLAVMYFAIGFSAIRFALGSREKSGEQNAGMTARLMQSGWGKGVLVVVALVIIAIGGYHVYKGATKRFLRDLKISGGQVVTPMGIVGYVAKGLALAGVGILVIVATFTADPGRAGGLDVAVKELGAAPFGKILLICAAIGFAAYGLYSFVMSRHGRM